MTTYISDIKGHSISEHIFFLPDNYPSNNCSTENSESLTLIENKTSAVVLSKMPWISKVFKKNKFSFTVLEYSMGSYGGKTEVAAILWAIIAHARRTK